MTTFDDDVAGSRRLGPITSDVTAVNLNVAADPNLNRQYRFGITPFSPLVAGEVPAAFPADVGPGVPTYSSNFNIQYGAWQAMPRSVRFFHDGDKVAWMVSGESSFMIYVDERPTSLVPYPSNYPAANAFHSITFPTAKPRLIEIHMGGYLHGIYCKKPYSIWKPPPRRGPRVLVIGDSYTSSIGVTPAMGGAYLNIGPEIGCEDVWLDSVPGSGYGVTSAPDGSGTTNRYLDRLQRTLANGAVWDVEVISPDMVWVHGGGGNDRWKGRTNAQVIADATALFTQLRSRLPDAKLVFVEGFSPPSSSPTINSDYVAIRAALQSALEVVGVYYVDVATTNPWFQGAGYESAPSGDGENSSIYISADTTHPNSFGHLYLRSRIAQKMRTVINDDENLVNALI